MGYHSADYNKDWRIDAAELARVTALAGPTNSITGNVTGCYKVDAGTVDGFDMDTSREIGDPVTLKKYHSADYNRDGRIDAAELARVTEIYNYKYVDTDVTTTTSVRTGQYFDNCPGTLDGFGLGPVSLSTYTFDTGNLPTINTNWVPTPAPNGYRLRAKFTNVDGGDFQAATSLNNDGYVLDTIPEPGVYDVRLYWVRVGDTGLEGDYDGDGTVTAEDFANMVAVWSGSLPQPTGSQYVRCDCAPRNTKGTGDAIGIADVLQCGRYKDGLDPATEMGGFGNLDTTQWVSDEQSVTVVISAVTTDCDDATRDCVCGTPEPIANEDKGKCFPRRVKLSCEAPNRPIPPCNDEEYYTVYDPNSTPKFKVVARLMDSACEPITDEDGNAILTTLG